MRFFAVTALLALTVAALPAGEADNSVVTRDLDINWAAQPSGSAKCGATARYGEHTYTENQIKVAFLTGAKLNAAGTQIGDRNYPHPYYSNQELPNGCGTKTHEFPILTANIPYYGDSVAEVPDRVLYEVSEGRKGRLDVKYCGVIRHGDGNGFNNCG